jgi:hypothetical protein
MKIPLYKGRFLVGWTEVDAEDYSILVKFLWRLGGPGYAVRYGDKGEAILMHRQIMGLTPGDGLEIDHRDRRPLNNRRSNLRLATRAQQILNTRTRSPHGRGVHPTKNGERWRAQCKADGKTYYLGTYDSPEEAHAAYLEARRLHHGEEFHAAR